MGDVFGDPVLSSLHCGQRIVAGPHTSIDLAKAEQQVGLTNETMREPAGTGDDNQKLVVWDHDLLSIYARSPTLDRLLIPL